jgi:hypothetical protein
MQHRLRGQYTNITKLQCKQEWHVIRLQWMAAQQSPFEGILPSIPPDINLEAIIRAWDPSTWISMEHQQAHSPSDQQTSDQDTLTHDPRQQPPQPQQQQQQQLQQHVQHLQQSQQQQQQHLPHSVLSSDKVAAGQDFSGTANSHATLQSNTSLRPLHLQQSMAPHSTFSTHNGAYRVFADHAPELSTTSKSIPSGSFDTPTNISYSNPATTPIDVPSSNHSVVNIAGVTSKTKLSITEERLLSGAHQQREHQMQFFQSLTSTIERALQSTKAADETARKAFEHSVNRMLDRLSSRLECIEATLAQIQSSST